MKLVEKGASREDAYALVQDIAMRVWKKEGTLRELAGRDAGIGALLGARELDAIFDISGYLKNIDYVFKNAGLEKER